MSQESGSAPSPVSLRVTGNHPSPQSSHRWAEAMLPLVPKKLRNGNVQQPTHGHTSQRQSMEMSREMSPILLADPPRKTLFPLPERQRAPGMWI